MNVIRPAFLSSSIALVAISSTVAQTQEDFALFKRVNDASLAAPAVRISSTITDRDSGALVETAVVERVRPDQLHFVTTRNGQPGSEMIFDSKRSLHRSSPNEPWKPMPMNLSEMFGQVQSGFKEDQLREQHAHLKPIGDDQVGGIAAKVYELTDDSGPSKMWLAADTFRPLKVERDYDGTVPMPHSNFGAKGATDLKSLHAQLKAATAQHHLHSVTTYTYDPSIKITMPPN